jgi:hypothetical protein
MQKDLERYTVSELRWLLINAIKQFIVCLGYSSAEELTEMRQYSKQILSLLKEREEKEKPKIEWVDNSTKYVEKSQQLVYLD